MSGFQAPHFTVWSCIFTGLGAMGYWCLKGRQANVRVFALSELLNKMGFSGGWLPATEMILFIAFGILVGIGAVDPGTPRQAIAAGAAWTNFLAVSGRYSTEKPRTMKKRGES